MVLPSTDEPKFPWGKGGLKPAFGTSIVSEPHARNHPALPCQQCLEVLPLCSACSRRERRAHAWWIPSSPAITLACHRQAPVWISRLRLEIFVHNRRPAIPGIGLKPLHSLDADLKLKNAKETDSGRRKRLAVRQGFLFEVQKSACEPMLIPSTTPNIGRTSAESIG